MNKPVGPPGKLDIKEILARESGSGWLASRRSWAAAGVAVLIAGLAAWWWFGSGGATAVRYVTEPAVLGDLTVVVTATGSVQPTNKVEVSSELSGTIREVLVDYNSQVTAGQPLARLDTDKLEATVDSSRAKLNAANARVAEAKATLIEVDKNLERKRQLRSTNAVSIQELDTAQALRDRAVASLASAQADVGVAEAELKLNETNLTKACICSPIDGVVLERNVDPGQTVASSLQAPILFSIAEDLTQMELQVDVDEADVGKVGIGQSASFTVDAFPDRTFPARIRDIRFASETIQGVVTYKAILDIDNSELLLRPGMTATAEITVSEVRDALLIANAALRYNPPAETGDSRSFLSRLIPGPGRRSAPRPAPASLDRTIWILRNGAPVEVKVETGPSDGTRTEVKGGDVQAGEALIVSQTTKAQ